MKDISYILAGVILTSALFVPAVARADIYTFTDDRGVKHYTNLPALDRRYKLAWKEGPRATWTATNTYMPSESEIARYKTIVEVASRTHGVEDSLVHAVITAESAYNPKAISKAGAQGIMQLMPGTAKRYGVTNSLDPAENIQGGVKYLKDLLTLFKGNKELALAGYNAGENAVIRNGNRIPPYAETAAYVPKVMEYYRKFEARKG